MINYQDAEAEEIRRNLLAIEKNRAALQIQLGAADDTELLNELLELERELSTLKNERGGLEPYQAKMIQVDAGSNAGSQIGRTVGNILDWATIFIPTPAKAGLLKKVATLPTKASKFVKGVLFGEKVTKTYATAKRLAQAKNFVQKAAQGIRTVKEVAPPSFLDYLTLEHWGEKLGQQFDSPPRYEEDLAYRREYFDNKRQLEQSILKKKQEIFRRKEQLNAFKNEQERKSARLASLEVDEQDLNRQLAGLEEKLRRDAKKKARAQWKSQWAKYYRETLPKFITAQTEQYLADLPERLEEYQARRFAAIEEKLAEKNAEYKSLADMREDDVAEKFRRTENILRQLEGAGYR